MTFMMRIQVALWIFGCLILLGQRSNVIGQSENSVLDADEELLIELRRRSLEAEAGVATDGSVANSEPSLSVEELDRLPILPGALGLLPAEPHYPADNFPSEARINLGRKLFFDRRLSHDRSMSCATCHDPGKGWSDGRMRAKGFGNQELGRHSPTILNVAYNTAQFWDGRAATLEHQALGPIMSSVEMNMKSSEEVIEMIRRAPEYVGEFESAYGSSSSMEIIGRAIAAFERTVVSGRSRFDRYVAGDKAALDSSEKRGLIMFITSASCTACHQGPNLTDNKFHSIGLRQSGPLSEDLGRFEITKDPKDKRCFKTPGLRNLEQSSPYMHDGSLATLEDVVEFYNKGGEQTEFRSNLMKPLNLSSAQKRDLVMFLRALSGPVPQIQIPHGLHFGT